MMDKFSVTIDLYMISGLIAGLFTPFLLYFLFKWLNKPLVLNPLAEKIINILKSKDLKYECTPGIINKISIDRYKLYFSKFDYPFRVNSFEILFTSGKGNVENIGELLSNKELSIIYKLCNNLYYSSVKSCLPNKTKSILNQLNNMDFNL